MTDITASALVGMCGELFAYSDDKPYLFFNRLGESDYIFLFNLGDKKLKRHFLDNPLPNDSFLFFNFEVLDGDYYGTGRLPAKKRNGVFIDYQWM